MATKVLLADGSADEAWVKKALGAAYTDVWLTFWVAFTADQLADVESNATFAVVSDGDFPITGGQNDRVAPTNDPGWETGWGSAVTPVPTETWIKCELNYNDGVQSRLYVDSVALTNDTPSLLGDTTHVLFGLLFLTPLPDARVFIKNPRVGTTRGGTDIFSDDFSSGDFTAWSDTFGDVSVVDDPFPDLAGINIAFGNNALDEDPDWTRIDDPDGYRLVTGYSIRRGNDSELDKADTGTATLRCRDLQALLDPTNPTSPFAGQLTPQKPALVMVQHPFTLEWHSLFRGFVDRYTHDLDMWTDERGIDRVQVELYDGFGYMSRLELMPVVHGHPVSITDFPDIYYQGTPSNLADEADVFVHVDDRIVKLLDDAGWPNTGQKREGLRDIFSGNVSVQGSVVDRGDGLMGALGDAVDAEFPGGANHYMSKDGVYRFRGRFAFINPENPGYNINFWNAGTATMARADPTVAAIADLQFADGEILNSVLATAQGMLDSEIAPNLVEDAASITEFGRSGATFPDLITSAGHTDLVDTNAAEETRKFADFYVGNRKDPKTVVSRLSFVGRTDEDLGPAVWDLICGVEIGDVISLVTTHPGGGGFDEELFVDSIEHTSDVGALHQLDLGVSPRPTYNPFGDIDSGVS